MIRWINQHSKWGARYFAACFSHFVSNISYLRLSFFISNWYLDGMNGTDFNTITFRATIVIEDFGLVILYAFRIYENSIRRFGGGLLIMMSMFTQLLVIQSGGFYIFETMPFLDPVGLLSAGISLLLPWIFVFLLSFVSWTVNPRDKFLLLSVLIWVVAGLVIPIPSPITGTKIEDDPRLMYMAATTVLISFVLVGASLVRQFSKSSTMLAISLGWYTIIVPLLAGAPYAGLNANPDVLFFAC